MSRLPISLVAGLLAGTILLPVSASAQVEEIVVTAQRREENLQKVPIAVSALTSLAAERLGVTGTASLVQATPALMVGNNGNAALIFLRGVGTASGSPNDEPSVALYVDGVYYPAADANYFDFNNIERVEVLKGPQGTLFGRNATGGVIQIITKNPTYEPTMNIDVGYANYDTISGGVYASTGLSEKAAINIAAQGSRQGDGWGKNLITGSDTFKHWSYSVRSKLLLEPSDNTRILLSGNYNRSQGPAVTGQAPPGATNLIGDPYPGKYNVWNNIDDVSRVKNWGASLKIEQEMGAVKLTSISAYTKVRSYFRLDQDLSMVNVVDARIYQGNDTITQEFQLASNDDSKLTWLVGAYYYHYNAKYIPLELRGLGLAAFGPTGADIHAGIKSQSFAVFGQATYPITDTTNITAGLRYTTEKVKHHNVWNIGGTDIVALPLDERSKSFKKLTWRLAIDQELAPEVMGYASYNRGFKSGSFSLVVPPGAIPPYKPETLDAFEVGLKSTLLDKRLTLNTAAFYYDYKNIQYQQIQPGVAFVINGPKAKIWGIETEAKAALAERFNISVSAAYLHDRFGDFPGAPRFDRLTAANLGTLPAISTNPAGCAAQPLGTNCQVAGGVNAKGNRMLFASDWTLNFGADYTIPTEIGDFTLASSVYYASKAYTSPDNRLKVDAHTLLNASLAWTSPSKQFKASLWGKNLLNKYYFLQAIEQDAPFGDVVNANAPRTYGIKLSYSFN